MSTRGVAPGGALRTIVAIARMELTTAWRDRSTLALTGALTLLLVTAAVVGQLRHDAEARQRQRYQAIVGEAFDTQPDRHPHRVSHYGYLVFRPPAPLGFFDRGIGAFTGTSVFLEAHRQNSANFSAAGQGSSLERLGDLSMAAVLQLFLPLFAFAVAGTALTREREQGTLSLLLCQGASWRLLLWGKFAGMLVLVSAAAAPGILIAGARLGLTSGGPWTSGVITRVALLLPVHGAFLATCVACAVLVSATQRTSRSAVILLASVWFMLWILVPRALPMLAEAVAPTPARAGFEAEVDARLRELGDSHDPNDPAFARLRADTLARYGVSRVEELPFNYGGLVNREGEARTSAAYRQHVDRLLATYGRQEMVVRLAGVLSPYVAVRLGSMALSGSDSAHAFEFERQAEAFRYRLIQDLNGLHMTDVSAARDRYGAVVNGAPTRERIDAERFRELARFEFEWPSTLWALRQQWLGLLAGLPALAAALAGLSWLGRRTPAGA